MPARRITNDYVELYNRGTTHGRHHRLVAAVRIGDGQRLGLQQAAARRHDRAGRVLPDRAGVGRRRRCAAAGREHHRPDQHERHEREDRAGRTASTALVGNCPIGDPHVDGPRRLRHRGLPRGQRRTAPAPSNTTAIFRLSGGSDDTNRTAATSSGAPNPRRTAPIVELGPLVLATDPRTNGVNAPRDATIVRSRSPNRSTSSARGSTSPARRSGAHDSATFAGSGQRSLHHAERELHRRRAVHRHDLQEPGPRSGSRRQRAEHRHAAGRLRRGRSPSPPARAPPYPAERAPDDGQSERCDGGPQRSRTTT